MNRIIALLPITLLASCAGTPISWDHARQLRVGMTESEVTKEVGKPYMVSSRSDGTQVWVWTFVAGLGGAESMTVIMKDGKAVQVPIIPASF